MTTITTPQAPIQRPDDIAPDVWRMAESILVQHRRHERLVSDVSLWAYLRSCGFSASDIDAHSRAALREFVRLAAADAGEQS